MFQNVGQGLFYTGALERFNFVYDCGSENDLFRDLAISTYRNRELAEKRIDLLTISHFHDDHVNGLDTLLRKVDVHTVIVPYFDPVERLILSLRRIDVADWYYEFLAEPIPFLFRKGVKRVIIVGGSKGEERPPFSSEELPPFPPEESKRTEDEDPLYIRMPKDDELEKIIAKEEPSWKDFGLILSKKHEGFIAPKAVGNWIFRFFNYKVEEKRLRSFRKCLVTKKIDLQNNAAIKAAITNTNTRATLAKCYAKLRKDLNNTSLALYHGPVGMYEANFQTTNVCELERLGNSCFSCRSFGPRCWFDRCENLGHFLTGDLSLNYAKKHLELMKHYRNQFHSMSTCQLPHHGAKGNWNNQILSKAQNCALWVASSGFSNSYGHPDIDVVLSILNARRFFMHNCEFNKVVSQGIVQW
jgi:hypothetical protein